MQLSNHIKITKVKDHTTSADTAVTSDAVDMSGYEGVVFVTSFGTANAGNTILASQDTASGGDYTDLLGTSVSSGTSDEDVWIDVYRPSKRYVRCEIARGSASTLESIYAIQYGPRVLPVSNVLSGTIIGEAHVSPAEGTA
jgi:hypothetical protein